MREASIPTILLIAATLLPVAGGQSFTDVSATSGVQIPANQAMQLGRGMCFGDFDGDGDQDLVVPEGVGGLLRYLRNEGNGTFSDQSAAAGFLLSGFTRGIAAADVDNDGDLDLFLANSYQPDQLFINDGSASFTEAASLRGLGHAGGSWTAAFADYDRDGWIDLYLGNYLAFSGAQEPNILYRNIGGGNFVDVTATAGVGNPGLIFTSIWHDYDEDGWPDLFIGNDKGYYPGLPPDTTYRNNGDGTFTEVGPQIGTLHGAGAMGADFCDAFNDGGWDIFVANIQAGHLFYAWNPQTQVYDEVANALGVAGVNDGWACHFMDYDNDGWQDLYIVNDLTPNDLFRNPGPAGGPWMQVAPAAGCDIGGLKYSLTVADFDDDGGIDILQPRTALPSVFLSNSAPGGNWIKVRTEGTRSNRSGIGAKVSVTVGGMTQRQVVRTGTGYLGGADQRLHFGVGPATIVDRISIWWPSGQTQVLDGIPANQVITVVEPGISLGAAPAIGTVVPVLLDVQGDASLPYAMVLTVNTSPGIPLSDGRVIPLDLFDPLAQLTLVPNPLFSGGFGMLDGSAHAQALLALPWAPAISGLQINAVGLSVDHTFADSVRTIIQPLPMTLQ
jgi:hypothetical protein